MGFSPQEKVIQGFIVWQRIVVGMMGTPPFDG